MTVGAAGLAAPAETPAAASRRTWMAVTMAGTAAFAAVAILAPATPQLPLAASAVVASVIAAVAEEAFFRRFLYGFLSRWGPALAVLGSAAAFALAHAPRYGWRAVSLDLGAGVVFGWQRWATGRWTSPAATHVVANLMGMGVLG